MTQLAADAPGSAVILGVGPGLGLSVAARFGRAGHPTALVSRHLTRHPDYRARLAVDGAAAVWTATADVRDPAAIERVVSAAEQRLGPPEILYFGPAALEPADFPVPIEQAGAADVRRVVTRLVEPAITAVRTVLPGMLERGRGTILLPTGLSAVQPMPALGNLAVVSAALRTYALTLHAAVADGGVQVVSIVIGGAIRGGDIYRAITGQHGLAGPIELDPAVVEAAALDPDQLAEDIWQLTHAERDRAEIRFSALG